MKLEDIINLATWQQVQDSFAKATGFAAITVDFQGKPLLKYSCFSKFCAKLREDPVYNGCCCQSDAHGSLEAVRRNNIYAYRCHAGLVDFAVPIIVDGQYIASMLCGQVRTADSDDIDMDFVKPSHNLFQERPELAEEYKKIPIISGERIKDTANLLYMTVNYIIEQHLLNQKNIKLLQDQKEKAELEKQYKDLEIKFYHSQINPHFLFNALNVAGRQAYIENAPKTQDIIFALADMYRCYLNYPGLLITIQQELINLKNYLFIQNIRFGEQLQYTIDVPESILDYMIPAMSLQIFVENAVRHGLEPKDELGHIHITGQQQGNQLHFEIADTGIGLTEHSLELLNDRESIQQPLAGKSGVGIHNVVKRLQHFFPDSYFLKFRNATPSGTIVQVTLPAKTSPASDLAQQQFMYADMGDSYV